MSVDTRSKPSICQERASSTIEQTFRSPILLLVRGVEPALRCCDVQRVPSTLVRRDEEYDTILISKLEYFISQAVVDNNQDTFSGLIPMPELPEPYISNHGWIRGSRLSSPSQCSDASDTVVGSPIRGDTPQSTSIPLRFKNTSSSSNMSSSLSSPSPLRNTFHSSSNDPYTEGQSMALSEPPRSSSQLSSNDGPLPTSLATTDPNARKRAISFENSRGDKSAKLAKTSSGSRTTGVEAPGQIQSARLKQAKRGKKGKAGRAACKRLSKKARMKAKAKEAHHDGWDNEEQFDHGPDPGEAGSGAEGESEGEAGSGAEGESEGEAGSGEEVESEGDENGETDTYTEREDRTMANQSFRVINDGKPIPESLRVSMYGSATITVTGAVLSTANWHEVQGLGVGNKLHALLQRLMTQPISASVPAKSLPPPASHSNFDMLIHSLAIYQLQADAYTWNSLRRIMALVEFSIRVSREVKENQTSLEAIFQNIHQVLKPSTRSTTFANSLRSIHQDGSRLLSIIEGGSFYYVLAVVSSEIVQELKYLTSTEHLNIAQMLKQPDPATSLGKVIIGKIIEGIRYLALRYPIPLGHLLSPSLLLSMAQDDPQQATSSLDRNRSVDWDQVQMSQDSDLIWSPSSSLTQQQMMKLFSGVATVPPASVTVINTVYQLKKPKIVRNETVHNLYETTQKMRAKVTGKMVEALSTENLKTYLANHLKRGGHHAQRPFVLFDTLNIQGRETLSITDDRGQPILVICANTPPQLSANAVEAFQNLMPDALKYTDSETMGKDYTYGAFHLSYYNKYRAIVGQVFSFICFFC
ncbi:hypothetical protein FA15DRAFT_662139 [Coprinopsis marcescibilis]|uniref:Uncharacterized protein n=1 Tax=Coprinopsis marcescibilis TaxID=230819 RepID=A0A5C3K8S0_COPMA|nr:hypothetical protein FA15DRAFT_662139 [Coprinopsis marcescibilis]